MELIPSYDARGLLPPFLGADAATPTRSPYPCTMTELVARFGDNLPRCRILRGLLDYRQLLYAHGYSDGVQLIDGSFVEDCETIRGGPPNDVDVFSWLSLPAQYASTGHLDTNGQAIWSNEITDRVRNKARFLVDAYAVLISELNFMSTFQIVNYWTSLFSHQRTTFAWKGFAITQLDAVNDQSALAALLVLEAAHA